MAHTFTCTHSLSRIAYTHWWTAGNSRSLLNVYCLPIVFSLFIATQRNKLNGCFLMGL